MPLNKETNQPTIDSNEQTIKTDYSILHFQLFFKPHHLPG